MDSHQLVIEQLTTLVSLTDNHSLNKQVFFPPLLILLLTIGFSFYSPELFGQVVNDIKSWVLINFGWLFSWSSFIFFILLIITFCLPYSKNKIGGQDAKPLLSRWKWFAISTCTTIATGILFWGCAEPLHHFHQPPEGLNLTAASEQAATFSMSTMYMHWTLTPYSIYCITALAFALVYYNNKQQFRISSLLYPLFGKASYGKLGTLTDTICLYSLVMGMAASLGAGILALMGGIDLLFNINKSITVLICIGLLIVASFILSAASGLQKGIKVLSDINIKIFIGLSIFVFIFGPTVEIISQCVSGNLDFIQHFLSRSTPMGNPIDQNWQFDWSIFYWANWFAWAPIASLFLGRLGVGYSIREFIVFNLLLPALFSMVWMSIFSGSTLFFDAQSSGALFELMSQQGEEQVMFSVISKLPLGMILSLVTLIAVFISYVTAADSNVSAMSAMSSKGISPENPEAPLYIKITWGLIIGFLALIMLSTSGIDGIRVLSIVGGFPAMLIIIIVVLGFVKSMLKHEY